MVDTTIASESQTNGSAKEINEVSTKNVKNAGPNPLVICGPSGSGKSTILKSIMSQPKYKDLLAFSVSHTTRKPRPGEVHGREYYFSDRDNMRTEIDAGLFIESAEFSGNLYGTSKESVHKCRSQGKICVLDIDSQGVRQLKEVSNLSPVYVFVKPPSMSTLEERLRSRKTETEESLRKRLDAARQEIAFGEEEGVFDALIVNDDLSAAVDQLTTIIDTKILHQARPPTDQCAGDVVVVVSERAEEVGGKRVKLNEAAECSRNSTPGVER